MESPNRRAFDDYADELASAARALPAAIGLVFFGSAADRSRVDEWSDHDFALVVNDGTQEALRSDLSWLPRFDHLVVVGREHHDGFKAFYANGSVIEFAVVSLAELGTFLANSWAVAYDDGGVTKVMDAVAAKTRAPEDRTRDCAVFLTALLVGVGRARRGEVLSASGSVRGVALDHLLTLLRSLPADDVARVDDSSSCIPRSG